MLVPLFLALCASSMAFHLPAIPLAVRSPYLSTWLPVGDRNPKGLLAAHWPTFWTGKHLGWTLLIRVDGESYRLMGDPWQCQHAAHQKSFPTITSTSSIFQFAIDKLDVQVKFTSPVEPKDLTTQSLPFSYMSVSTSTSSKKGHQVEVYTDISGEWVAYDSGRPVFWKTVRQDDIIIHSIEPTAPEIYKEERDMLIYGRAVYATRDDARTTWQTGPDNAVRHGFIKNGRLDNSADPQFRRMNDRWPIIAYTTNLGLVTTNSSAEESSTLFAIGHVRDPAVSYRRSIDSQATESRHIYYMSQFASWESALAHFYHSYDTSIKKSEDLDAQIEHDALVVSRSFADICIASVRQAYAAIELTVGKQANGDWNMSDISFWQKEISSNGNVNTVDVIYPAIPLLLYLSPDYVKYLLAPIFEYQSDGRFESCLHDMGSHYPYGTGPSDGIYSHMPVEESGNIIIIALAYTQATGDKALIEKNYWLLEMWSKYLLKHALIPEHQFSTDDFAGPLANQSSLALKGGIAIRAMAEIAHILGKPNNYTEEASTFFDKWQKFAISPKSSGHMMLSYHHHSSWATAYNLYAAKLLGLDVLPSEFSERQDAQYLAKANRFGVPLDSRHTWTKSDWEIWTAASTNNTKVRDLFINGVHNFMTAGRTDAPFPDFYETTDGSSPQFRARPVVGGHFAFQALKVTEEGRKKYFSHLQASKSQLPACQPKQGSQIVFGAGTNEEMPCQ